MRREPRARNPRTDPRGYERGAHRRNRRRPPRRLLDAARYPVLQRWCDFLWPPGPRLGDYEIVEVRSVFHARKFRFDGDGCKDRMLRRVPGSRRTTTTAEHELSAAAAANR